MNVFKFYIVPIIIHLQHILLYNEFIEFTEKGASSCYNNYLLHLFYLFKLYPGYEDHASDVFLVQTEDEEVIVRSSKMTEEPNNDFWWGCKTYLELIRGTYII